MNCKAIAAKSCKEATTSLCVCNCGGECHGQANTIESGRRPSEVRTITGSQRAMIDALDILNLYYPILIQRRKRRKHYCRPKDHATLLKRLWRAGIHTQIVGQGNGVLYTVRGSLFPGIAISGLNIKLLEEIIDILRWADVPEPEGEPPTMTEHLKAEVEEILEAMYLHKPFDPDSPEKAKESS